MRDLTGAEIERFAARKGARRIAVENFLGSMDTVTMTATQHRVNLSMDAGLYKWNTATVSAIAAGITLAYRGR